MEGRHRTGTGDSCCLVRTDCSWRLRHETIQAGFGRLRLARRFSPSRDILVTLLIWSLIRKVPASLPDRATILREYGTSRLVKIFSFCRGTKTKLPMWSLVPMVVLFATASDDGTARIWEVATGQEIVVLRGHSAEVTDVEFSPEGDHILTASWDGSIRTWEVISGSPLFVMRGPTNPVRRASFDRGGLRVLSSSTDNTIRIWSAIDGEQLSVLSGHGGSPKTWTFPDGRVLSIGRTAIDDAGFSPNGARVISASDDGTVRIWDSETGAVLAVLAAHDGPIT